MKLFICHIMKTGGISLRTQLPDVQPAPGSGAPAINAYLTPPPVTDGIVMGHYPACAYDWPTTTCLRDPIERTLSWLRAHQDHNAPDRTLDEIYNDRLHQAMWLGNHQTRVLGATKEELTAEWPICTNLYVTREHLDRAKETLDAMPFFGVTEAHSDWIDRLATFTGLPLDHRHDNTTPTVASDLHDRIAADTELDRELWEYATVS